MRIRALWLCGLLQLLGCASPNPAVRVQELEDGSLQVEGPLAGPFTTTEELASAACELMTAQPGADATHGSRGKEYCALHYYSEQEHGYFLSFLSDIGGDGPDGRKYCLVPRKLHELEHRRVVLLGPAHNHPHNPRPSERDMGALRPAGWSPLGTSRVLEQETGRIWDRELYIFHKDKLGHCIAYSYNYATRVVSALRAGHWIPIGKAEGDWGAFKAFEGKDWLP